MGRRLHQAFEQRWAQLFPFLDGQANRPLRLSADSVAKVKIRKRDAGNEAGDQWNRDEGWILRAISPIVNSRYGERIDAVRAAIGYTKLDVAVAQ